MNLNMKNKQNKKVILRMLLIIILFIAVLFSTNCKKQAKGPVKLIFTSWRTEDINRMNTVNKVFMDKNPDIIIDFQPISDKEYDAQMQSALESGVGADIIFLRSYDPGRIIYNNGYLKELNDVIPELKDFPSAAVKAW